jgi:hypothetical protein
MTTETETVAAPAASEPKTASTADVKPVSAEIHETEDAAPSADPQDGSNPDDTPVEHKPDGGVQKKINKLTARAKAAEAERDRIYAELESARQTRQAPQQPAGDIPKPPTLEDFNYDEVRYQEARDKYVADLAVRRVYDEVARSQDVQAQQAEADRKRQAGQRFREKAEAAAERYEHLDDAMEAFHKGGISVSVPMIEFVYEHAEDGPAIVHHLYANQELAEKIAKLSPLAAARELARLEASLPKPQPRNISNAPRPPSVPKGGAEPPVRDLENMSMADFAALRRKQEAAERARRFKG